LQKLVHAARELVDARYAAIGLPDERGGFEEFITSGMTEAEISAIGPLPRTHGMLDAVMQSTGSVRMPDLQTDHRFGGWPANHPDMRSMLGVPIVSKGTVIGAFYLTGKKGAKEFDEADQMLIERFAAHAAIVVENALLFEQSRELSIVEERNRLARDLHDSVTQTLFSLSLTAEAAAELIDGSPERAKLQVRKVAELARESLEEMRGLVFQLRPGDLSSEGLVPTLRKHLEFVERLHGTHVDIDVTGERRLDPGVETALFRIVQEALNNALKHAKSNRLHVVVEMTDGVVRCVVSDNGVGFKPGALPVRTKHLGLTSMEERVRELGGSLRIDSAPGEGTTVSVEVPL
jgi:signal transduction histidine kinase